MDGHELLGTAKELCASMDAESCRVALVTKLGEQAVDQLTDLYFQYPFNRDVYARRVVADEAEAVVVQAVAPSSVHVVTRLVSEFAIQN